MNDGWKARAWEGSAQEVRDAWDAARQSPKGRLYHWVRTGPIGRWYRRHDKFGLSPAGVSAGDMIGLASWAWIAAAVVIGVFALVFTAALWWVSGFAILVAAGLWWLAISVD